MISDEQLMGQIKYGEKTALDILVRRYHSPIHAYIVRMGLEYHLTNDIVQEVFIKLIRNIQSYELDRPFRPWLYTIASNVCKDYFKKAYVQKNILAADIPESNSTSADNPEEIFMLQQNQQTIVTALDDLSQIHREIVVLRYYQDLKLDEISLILKIPLGTVKSRLSNALHRLKKILTEGAILDDNKVG